MSEISILPTAQAEPQPPSGDAALKTLLSSLPNTLITAPTHTYNLSPIMTRLLSHNLSLQSVDFHALAQPMKDHQAMVPLLEALDAKSLAKHLDASSETLMALHLFLTLPGQKPGAAHLHARHLQNLVPTKIWQHYIGGLAERLVDQMKAVPLGQQGTLLRITLKDKVLPQTEVILHRDNGHLHIQLHTQNPSVKHLLERKREELTAWMSERQEHAVTVTITGVE